MYLFIIIVDIPSFTFLAKYFNLNHGRLRLLPLFPGSLHPIDGFFALPL